MTTYARVSKNSTRRFTPSATLPFGTQNPDAPTSGVVDLLYLVSSRTTNELRIGTNYSEPLNSTSSGGADIAISVPSFSTIPARTFRVAIGHSQSIVDQRTSFRGTHTLNAGFDLRHVQLEIHDGPNAQAGTLTYASLADFQANRVNTAEYSAELPMKDLRKFQYFGYLQDDWPVIVDIGDAGRRASRQGMVFAVPASSRSTGVGSRRNLPPQLHVGPRKVSPRSRSRVHAPAQARATGRRGLRRHRGARRNRAPAHPTTLARPTQVATPVVFLRRSSPQRASPDTRRLRRKRQQAKTSAAVQRMRRCTGR